MSLETRILAVVQAIAVDIKSLFINKQTTLVSTTNIKSLNGVSLLGSGDIVTSGSINDETTTLNSTWSSSKINTQLGDVAAALTTINGT